jgi:hypothetical protein
MGTTPTTLRRRTLAKKSSADGGSSRRNKDPGDADPRPESRAAWKVFSITRMM